MRSPATVKTLYVFRHGETDWNRAGRMQGCTDIPLNDLGRQQALELKEFFETTAVDVFLTSDLQRAVETSRIAIGDRTIGIVQDPRLRETNMGQIEGLTHEEILEQFGAELITKWRSTNHETRDFRFPGGESKPEHLARLLAGLEEFLHQTPHARIAVASHGGAIRRLIQHMRPDVKDLVMVGNCSVYELTYDTATRIWQFVIEPVRKGSSTGPPPTGSQNT